MDPTAFASIPQSDRLPGDCLVFVILLKSGLADCGSIGLRFENFLKGKEQKIKQKKPSMMVFALHIHTFMYDTSLKFHNQKKRNFWANIFFGHFWPFLAIFWPFLVRWG